MSLTLTHRIPRYLECDLCFWPVAQESQFIVAGDVVRHLVCPARPARLPPSVGASAKKGDAAGGKA